MLTGVRIRSGLAGALIWAAAGSALGQTTETQVRADPAVSFAGVTMATTMCGDYGYEIDSDRLIEEIEQFVSQGVEAGRDRATIMSEIRIALEAEYASLQARQATMRSASGSQQLRDAFREDVAFWRDRCAGYSQAYPLVLKADGDEDAVTDRLMAGLLNAVSELD
jgi:hypothetical protein